MENWDQYNKEIKKAIKEDGTTAIIRKKKQGEYNVTTGKKTTTNTDYNVHIIFLSASNMNEQIAQNEMMVICANTTDGIFEEKLKSATAYLVYEGNEYEILNVKPVMPGGTVIFYKLTCSR